MSHSINKKSLRKIQYQVKGYHPLPVSEHTLQMSSKYIVVWHINVCCLNFYFLFRVCVSLSSSHKVNNTQNGDILTHFTILYKKTMSQKNCAARLTCVIWCIFIKATVSSCYWGSHGMWFVLEHHLKAFVAYQFEGLLLALIWTIVEVSHRCIALLVKGTFCIVDI